MNKQSRENLHLSLREYTEQAWKVVEPATPFIPNWHIDAICEHLTAVTTGQIRQLLINIPPRHMKSLLASVFWPTWTWTFKPSHRWLTASYARELAIRDAVKSRRIIRSDWYQRNWSHVFALTGDQNVKSRYDNDHYGYRLVTSTDSSVTGEGGDSIIIDDPHNVMDALSDTKRATALTWFDQAMSTRLNDLKVGSKVIIMQRIHEEDLSGHVLERPEEWVHLRLPARYEPQYQCIVPATDFVDPRTEEDQLLWPAHVPEQELTKLEIDLGPYGAAGQLQQRPTPLAGGLFRYDWFKDSLVDSAPTKACPNCSTLTTLNVHCRECGGTGIADALRWVRYWDLAASLKTTADYTASVEIAEHDGIVYLRDMIHLRAEWPDQKNLMRETMLARPRTVHGIEKALHGIAALQELARDSDLVGIVIHGIDVDTDKLTRALPLSGRAAAGHVRLVRGPWVESFLKELCTFPMGAHDDQVDTASGGLRMLGTVRRVGDISAALGSMVGRSTWAPVATHSVAPAGFPIQNVKVSPAMNLRW